MTLSGLARVLLAGTAFVIAPALVAAQPAPAPPEPAPAEPVPSADEGPRSVTEPLPPPPSVPQPPTPVLTPPSAVPPSLPSPGGAIDMHTATEQRLAAAAACSAHEATCDWMLTFSSLEKLSIRRAIAALGLEIDPSPWGKVVGRIRVYNEDVFAEKNILGLLNYFHITTRQSAVRRELTINEGQAWDDELIAESSRRLKDPLYTGVVALLPTKSAEPGKVDLLVVTRDIWSLRLNTQYQIQQGTLTNLSVSLSENNFLGLRKTVALGWLMDLGSITAGPLFIDKNFLGEHVDFRFQLQRIFTRQSLDVIAPDPMNPSRYIAIPSGDPCGLEDCHDFNTEGHQYTFAMTKTLWSLASEWGGGASFNYRDAINRTYLGTGLRSVDNPNTPDTEFLPREYRIHQWSVSASATRQWGNAYKNQLQAGYSVSDVTPSFLPNFPTDPATRIAFAEEVFPRKEIISSPFIEYSLFRASYRTIRNVDTFDLAEDLRLGPNVTVGLQQSLKVFASTDNFTRPSITAGWTFPWSRDGFVRLSAGSQLRLQGGEAIDSTAAGSVRAATPTLDYFRVVSQVGVETRWNDTQNAFYTLGSDSGLRAYALGQFIGERRILGQIEARSVPYPFWVLRLGAVAFYEVGGVAPSFNEMILHSDVGVGFRMLIPQTARDLFRFDFAKPLDGDNRCPLPGNICFIAGFDSYF